MVLEKKILYKTWGKLLQNYSLYVTELAAP